MKILPPLQEEDSMMAALSYPFWYIVSWLILLSQKREEPFVKFHAIQSLVFGAGVTLCSILLTLLLWGAFQLVPSMDKMIKGDVVWKGYIWKGLFFVILFTLFCFALCVLWVIIFYYAYRAYKGEYFKIKFIGNKIEAKYFSYLKDEEESLEMRDASTMIITQRQDEVRRIRETRDASTRIIIQRQDEVREEETRDTSTRIITQRQDDAKGKELPDTSGGKYILKRFDDSPRDDRL